jgi:hypothetical protein
VVKCKFCFNATDEKLNAYFEPYKNDCCVKKNNRRKGSFKFNSIKERECSNFLETRDFNKQKRVSFLAKYQKENEEYRFRVFGVPPLNTAKDTKDKLDLTTVPPELIEAVAKVRKYGIKKYKLRDNWKQVSIHEYWKALYRHLLSSQKGEVFDKESGLKHSWHIGCNIAFIIALEETK